MSQPVIYFENVWKKFRRGERHDSLRDLMPSLVRSLARGNRRLELDQQEFWALEDVSFEVRPGEALGIIGPNGAGKSTVLKLLTRLLRPTIGRAGIVGRVGALIEIAAGFHPDLTGRENVYLQGAIMGMPRKDINSKFDEIVEFAGTADFMDTPVKRYSTGMNARLGFSIAAHLNPAALVIDEVLAVGDAAFQQKCVERMRGFKRMGTAIVFVSHNLQAVSDLCDHVLYLNKRIQAFGPPNYVLEKYLRDIAPAAGKTDGRIEVREAKLTNSTGEAVSVVKPGTELTLRISVCPKEAISNYHVALVVYRSTDGLPVYDANWTGEELGLEELQPDLPIDFDIRFRAHLTRGHYYASWHLHHNPTHTFLAVCRPAGFFTVEEHRTYTGIADLEASVTACQNAVRQYPRTSGIAKIL